MIRPILRHGAGILHAEASPVIAFDKELETLIEDMVQTMYAASGVGLAAPQIGVGFRIFVADPSSGHSLDELITVINPKVLEQDGIQTEEEGCLSLPGFTDRVNRPSRVVLSGYDKDGSSIKVEGTDLLARVLQHEMDHLNGSLFVDRLHGFRKQKIVRRVRKLQRTGKW
ncbi:MAG: peptide deformylase [Acidobacteria bacterium]|nr:peptide deformylase [Acidobacteriota bacterium]|tara:strand:- start:11844 stop:12353 length:510 start_codon:yes stop_codon:yes gene_type:complete